MKKKVLFIHALNITENVIVLCIYTLNVGALSPLNLIAYSWFIGMCKICIVVECDDVENISIDFLRNFGSGWQNILSYNLILSYLVYTCSNSFVIAL